MSDTDTTPDAAAETSGDSTETQEQVAPDSGEAALGDAGKKALDAMKSKWKDAETARKALEADFQSFKAKAEGKEAEFTAAQEAQRVRDEALSKANDRIRKSEVKAAAKGVLADPADAYKFLDLDSFEVDNDGNVDETAIASALADLVKDKPYLAAQGGKRFQGTADGGARNDANAKPSQLSEADLASMSPDQINQARREGRLDNLLRR